MAASSAWSTRRRVRSGAGSMARLEAITTVAASKRLPDGRRSYVLDAGVNLIDTANIYTNGHSGKIIGDWFAARPGRRAARSRRWFPDSRP